MPKVTDLTDIGAIDANDIIYVVDGSTGVSKKGTISNLPSNPPAGSNGDFQYNDAGSLGAAPMDYNDTRANAISASAPLYVDQTITAQAVTDDDRQIIVKNNAGDITASIRGNGNVQGLTGIFANLQAGDTLVSNIEVVGALESATAVIGSCASPDTSAALNVCANPGGGVSIASASVPAVDGHYTASGTINGYTKYLQDRGTYYLFVCLGGSGLPAASWAIDEDTAAYYNAVQFQQSIENLNDPFNAYYLNPLNVSQTASVQNASATTKAANFVGDVVVDGEVSAVDGVFSGYIYGSRINTTNGRGYLYEYGGHGGIQLRSSAGIAKLSLYGDDGSAVFAGNISAALGTLVSLRVTNGAAVGKVLTSDASGNASWQTPVALNPFDQSLNTDDGVTFTDAILNGDVSQYLLNLKVLDTDRGGFWVEPDSSVDLRLFNGSGVQTILLNSSSGYLNGMGFATPDASAGIFSGTYGGVVTLDDTAGGRRITLNASGGGEGSFAGQVSAGSFSTFGTSYVGGKTTTGGDVEIHGSELSPQLLVYQNLYPSGYRFGAYVDNAHSKVTLFANTPGSAFGVIQLGDNSTTSVSVDTSSGDLTATGDISAVNGVFSGQINVGSSAAVISSSGITLSGGSYLSSRSGVSDVVLGGKISTDASQRLRIQANGVVTWGDGTGTFDVTLYRYAANLLRTDDSLYVGGDITATGDISAVDGVFSGQIKPSTMPTTAGGAGNYRLYCAGVGQPVYWG